MEIVYAYIEYFGFVTGVLYLVFEIKQMKLMWLVGILSALAYIVVFAGSSLYAAMGLQVYFFWVSIYGWFEWRKGERILAAMKREEKEAVAGKRSGDRDAPGPGAEEAADRADPGAIFYRVPTKKMIAGSAGCFLVIFGLLLTVLRNLTGDPMPVADAAATALSVIATFWLSRSYRAQWLLWIVVNILTVWLCVSQQLYITSGLYVIYVIFAVYGYFHWGRKGILLREDNKLL